MAMVLLGVPVTTFAADIPSRLDVVVSVAGKDATIECTLTDEDGTALAGEAVTVTVAGPAGFTGVSYTIATDGVGQVIFTECDLPAGSYRVVATFAGGDGYDVSEDSTDFYLWGITLKDEKGTEIEAGSPIYRAVEVGDQLTFSAAVDSGDAENKGVTWSVSDKDIATIDAATGKLTVKTFGEVWVTATSNDNESVYAEFHLDLRERLDVTGLRILDWTGKDVTNGSTALAVSRGVTALFAPAFGPDFAVADPSQVAFTVDNDSVATVSSWGDLTVKDYGTVKVTATSLDDPSKSATVAVTVSPPSAAVPGRGEPHSVALLTLTATGKTGEGEDKLTADMTWKTFIPGTTVDLELKFVMPDGSVAGQVNLMDWVATYGDMAHTDPGFVPLVPSAFGRVLGPRLTWLSLGGDEDAAPGSMRFFHLEFLFVDGDGSGAVSVLPGFSLLASLVDFVFPFAGSLSIHSPGLARLSPGASVTFDAAWISSHASLVPSFAFSSDPSVAVYEDGYITGLSEGTATLTFKQNGSVCGSVEVAVGDWVPPYEVPAGLTAVAGTRLGDVALPAPTDAGAWAWVRPDDLLTTPGTTTHKALYTPTDTDIDSYCPVLVDVPVEVYLETTVNVKGQQQRLRVYDTNKILPAGTQLKAEAVTGHTDMDTDYEVEHLLAYNIWLEDANGAILVPPFSNTVELCFEVLDFLDEDELETVLVQQFDDREFDETPVERDGARWILIDTDHFSPYALIDTLTDAEKATLGKGNPTTGERATYMAVSGLGMVLVLALGIMLRLLTGKKKFED